MQACKGFYVIDLFRCDSAKHPFNVSGREDHNKADHRVGWIAPGMGVPLLTVTE